MKLRGRYLHAPQSDGSTWQGQIVAGPSSTGRYEVEWFSWFDGCTTYSTFHTTGEIEDWKLFPSHEAFLDAGDRHQRRLAREAEAEAEKWRQEQRAMRIREQLAEWIPDNPDPFA